MKQVILMTAVLGSVCFGVNAQSNRTYYTDMQTQQMYENERRGGTPTNNTVRLSLGSETSAQEMNAQNNSLQMNTMQQHQGYRMNTMQRYYGESSLMGPSEMLDMTRGYDTSKNNGTCIGCGSGAITDHRRDLMNR
ncbi:MAG TPA: hypothetical protein PL009_07580 [Flavipsychrobacter sp.]|mgnify:CR=1 FL=1|nr:hypothetical protein [Flavipsychrobacter sp.]